MQKLLFISLLLIIAFFQYELRYGHGGIHDQELLHNNILKGKISVTGNEGSI